MTDPSKPFQARYDPGLPVHDTAALVRLRALIGEGAVQGLLDQLAQELPRRRVSVAEACARGDRLTAGREAHALSSPAGLLGFVALRAACQSLQAPGAPPPGRPMPDPAFDACCRGFDAACAAVSAVLGSVRAGF